MTSSDFNFTDHCSSWECRRRGIHVSKTPGVPKEMRELLDQIASKNQLRREQRTQAGAPKVGIFFVHDSYLWIDSTLITQAVPYGDVLTHDKGHDAYWEELQACASVPRDEEYDECPRGRVCYDTKTKIFHLYLDRCILKRKDLVERIILAMNLPPETLTESRH